MEKKDKFLVEHFIFSVPMIPVIKKGQLPEEESTCVNKIKKHRVMPSPKNPLNLDELKTSGFKSIPLSIHSGKNNLKETNREYRTRYKEGDKSTVIKLLERDPRFIIEPWVRKALMEKPVKKGKKYGSTKVSRTKIIALVNAYIEQGFSEERAFWILSKRIGIGHDRIRDLWYESKNISRYKPLLQLLGTSNSLDEPADFEQFISNLKDEMSKGIIIHPDHMDMEFVRSTYGNEKSKELLTVYIEEAQKLLNEDDNNEIIQGAKKMIIENCLIEKANSLMAQV